VTREAALARSVIVTTPERNNGYPARISKR